MPDAPIQVADALRAAANKAADLIERLHYDAANAAEERRQVDLGYLPDGTPVADMLAAYKELEADFAKYKLALTHIRNMCDAPHFDSARRWKIRDRCNLELKTPHGG